MITDERFNISLVNMTLTIIVMRVQVSDGGSYRVDVFNSEGNDFGIFQVETKGELGEERGNKRREGLW